MASEIIVIREQDAEAINTMCAGFSDSWANTFTVPLSANGSLPASHRWCGVVTNAGEDTFVASIVTAYPETKVYSNNETGEEILTTLGLKRIEPDL